MTCILPACPALAFPEGVVTFCRTEPVAFNLLGMIQHLAALFARFRAGGACQCLRPFLGLGLSAHVLYRMRLSPEMKGCMSSLRWKFGKVLRTIIVLDPVNMMNHLAGLYRIVRVRLIPYDPRPEAFSELHSPILCSPASTWAGLFCPDLDSNLWRHSAWGLVRAGAGTEFRWGSGGMNTTEYTSTDRTDRASSHGLIIHATQDEE